MICYNSHLNCLDQEEFAENIEDVCEQEADTTNIEEESSTIGTWVTEIIMSCGLLSVTNVP